MKTLFITILSVFMSLITYGQKFYTKNGKINFDATSASSPERIEAINRGVTCVMDTKTGAIQFVVLMKGFEFERAMMEEHFNENYVESQKFPKGEFRGMIKDNNINYSKEGTNTVKVIGKLTMHGVTNDVDTDAKIIIQKGKINALADFIVNLSDYNISIPGLVADKVSKTAKISVSCLLDPLNN